mgnify:CR=1 FL=1
MGKNKLMDFHRFLDEAGDTTFYGKGKKNSIGTNGVSNVFILGMVKVKDPLGEVRDKINELQEKITQDEFYHVPSVLKKINKTAAIFLKFSYILFLDLYFFSDFNFSKNSSLYFTVCKFSSENSSLLTIFLKSCFII